MPGEGGVALPRQFLSQLLSPILRVLAQLAGSPVAAGPQAAIGFSRPAPAFLGALQDVKVVSKPQDVAAGLDGRKPPLIGTHDGTFHCDEALACAMLKMLPEYESAVVVRTRDAKALEECDVVVDVGAVYDKDRHRYDHHQKEFTDVMAELGHKTKLSSAGLIYRHFGAQVVARLAAALFREGGNAAPDYAVLYRKVYKGFIEHVDGIDNGIEAFDSSVRNYEVPTTLSDRVASLNPRWNEPEGPEEINVRFKSAVGLTGREFTAAVEAAVNSWWPARALVAEALDSAAKLHPSKQILELKSPCPWQSHIFQLESERATAGDAEVEGAAKYVIFPDTKGGGWRIQAVPVEEGSFKTRRPLPEPWRGVRDERLSALLELEGCVFVHAGGFIGGHATREGALAMALKAIAA